MKDKVEVAGTVPGAMVAERGQDAEEYHTGRGCLTLLLILIALAAISVLAVMLGGDPAQVGGS